MEYKELIKIIEEKRKKLYVRYKKTIFFKKILKKYLNEYDELLLKFYTKYKKF